MATHVTRAGLGLALGLWATTVCAGEWSGYAALAYTGYMHAPLYADQARSDFSAALQPEYRHRRENSKDEFTFIPFVRLDQQDAERSHGDIRELAWVKVGEAYEWRVGVRKVFWGVAESQHLVNIINQTDLVENIDAEAKLGQPMVNFAAIRSWGTLDVFILPYFRERTFPGRDGRLRTELVVDTDQATYESSRGRRHVDYALRWSKSFSGVDIGVSRFYGTSRDPRLLLGSNGAGTPVLAPRYDLIHQTGVDVALTAGSWLWKLEAIHRSGPGAGYTASTAGFEYTFSNIFNSTVDLGVLAEYLYDERGDTATTPFQDDIFAGLRLAFNDAQGSELLLGAIQDRRSHARFFNVEASRRLGSLWKLSLQARAFTHIPVNDLLFGMRQDDYIQVELARYF